MKKLHKCLLVFLIAIGTVSCIKESKDDDEICLRDLRLEIDWVNTEPLDVNESIPVDITSSAGNTDRIQSAVYGRDLELVAGNYRFAGWEPADNITVSGTTVTVASSDSGLSAEPSFFSGGVTSATVRDVSGVQVVTLPFYQQTRPLIIHILFTGYGASIIENAAARLTGVTLSRDISNGFPPANGATVNPAAIRSGYIDYSFAFDEETYFFVGARTLLGMDGTTGHNLEVNVDLTIGSSTQITVDLSEETRVFHTENVENPMNIYLVLNIGLDLDMTIVDWYGDTEIPLEAF